MAERRLARRRPNSPLVAGVMLAAVMLGGAAPPDARLLGHWYTEDRSGVIRIGPCGDAACGVIVGLSHGPGEPVPRDVTGVTQCGLTLISGLRPGDDGRLHGSIRNPEDGRVYSAQLWLGADGDLRLRGYVGLPVFGSTQRWTRFDGTIGRDCGIARAR